MRMSTLATKSRRGSAFENKFLKFSNKDLEFQNKKKRSDISKGKMSWVNIPMRRLYTLESKNEHEVQSISENQQINDSSCSFKSVSFSHSKNENSDMKADKASLIATKDPKEENHRRE